MKPILSHIETINNINFWITTDKIVGCSFRIDTCDLEIDNYQLHHDNLATTLKTLDPRILARIETKVERSCDIPPLSPRKDFFKEHGFIKKQVYLHLEYRGGIFIINEIKKSFGFRENTESYFEVLNQAFEQFQNAGLSPVSLSGVEIERLFSRGVYREAVTTIETMSGNISIFKMVKQPAGEFSISHWLKIQNELPKPFEISISFRRIPEEKTRIMLERRLKQTASATDIVSKSQNSSTEDQILENFEEGSQLFEMELQVLFNRTDHKTISRERTQMQGALARFGEFTLETFGLTPSYMTTMPGCDQHVPLLESEKALAQYLFPFGHMVNLKNT